MVPIFLLSGALFPLEELPRWVQSLCYVNPFFYGVDGLRFSFLGISTLPVVLDFLILIVLCCLFNDHTGGIPFFLSRRRLIYFSSEYIVLPSANKSSNIVNSSAK